MLQFDVMPSRFRENTAHLLALLTRQASRLRCPSFCVVLLHPCFRSVQTIMSDTMLTALKALGQDDLLRDFNLPFLCANCIAARPKYKRIILRDMYKSFQTMDKNQLSGTLQFCYSLLSGPGWVLFKRIANRGRIILLGDKTVRVNDVKDIVEATNILTRYLRERGKQFSEFI